MSVDSASLQPVSEVIHLHNLEEYFALEDQSEDKYEFYNGKIKKMAGGSVPHNVLAQRCARLIDNFVEAENLDYLVANSDMKIRIEQENKVIYPDAVVIFSKPIFYKNRKDTITNPLIVVEVLSKRTSKHDRGEKFDFYRTLPSFKEYVLVRQDVPEVNVYTKRDEATWVLRKYEGIEAVAQLNILHNCPLVLSSLYRGLEV